MCKTKYNRPDSGTALVPQLQYESFELTIIYRDTTVLLVVVLVILVGYIIL